MQFTDAMAESMPGGQESHAWEPSSSENFPAGHDRHVVLPVEVKDTNVPGKHCSTQYMLAPYLTTFASTHLSSCASPPCTSNTSSIALNPWKYLLTGGSPDASTFCQTFVSVENWYMSSTKLIPLL